MAINSDEKIYKNALYCIEIHINVEKKIALVSDVSSNLPLFYPFISVS